MRGRATRLGLGTAEWGSGATAWGGAAATLAQGPAAAPVVAQVRDQMDWGHRKLGEPGTSKLRFLSSILQFLNDVSVHHHSFLTG